MPPKKFLASKEATLFKELLSLYENRQLKKGIKTADAILKKNPEHGETLCMKGLILTHMGRREEGLELVRKGIRFDLTSHIVWHVFGLIQKGEKNYEEALKSYTQALRFDKENMNILRDAAHLQTQLRLYDQLVDTRHTLLRLRPNLRQNWIGLAVAHHLNGNITESKKILEGYERMLKNVPDYDAEHSEAVLYHVRVLEELEETEEALRLLDISAKSRVITDRVAIMETRARLLSKMNSEHGADEAWRSLIQHNPDNHEYYRGLLKSKNIDLDDISETNREEALHILKELSEQNPRADTPKRLALTVATGDEFKTLVQPYLLRGLKKGIPSLFADVKSLSSDPSKRQIIQEVAESYKSLEESGAVLSEPSAQPSTSEPSAIESSAGASSSAHEPPTTYLWTLYFLAQHYSSVPSLSLSSSTADSPAQSQSRPDHDLSLSLLDTAIQHTPTLPELLMFKARVLKRVGDPWGAVGAMEEARRLDGQDRFLNAKCGKYWLRAGGVDEASEVFGLFTKKDAPSPGSDLEDMQSLIYLTEEANAQNRAGKLHLALKKYHAIHKVFDEIEDDQYDFHGYSIRKSTVNIYLDLLKWEDKLRAHPAYVAAAIAATRIYIKVHDDPSVAQACLESGNTDSDKKAKKKAKKAAHKEKQAEDKKVSATEDKGLDVPPAKDEDPDGSKLLTSTDPLEKAWKFLSPLLAIVDAESESEDVQRVKKDPRVWIAIYDVSVRRGKWLLAARALTAAKALNGEHPELHSRLLHFRKTQSSLSEPLPESTAPIVSEALSALLPAESEQPSEAYNSSYLQRHPTDPCAVLATAQGLKVLDGSREEVENLLFGVFGPEVILDIPTALDILSFLKDLKSPRTDEFRVACDSKFEKSTVFKLPAEQAGLKKKVKEAEIVPEESGKGEKEVMA